MIFSKGQTVWVYVIPLDTRPTHEEFSNIVAKICYGEIPVWKHELNMDTAFDKKYCFLWNSEYFWYYVFRNYILSTNVTDKMKFHNAF